MCYQILMQNVRHHRIKLPEEMTDEKLDGKDPQIVAINPDKKARKYINPNRNDGSWPST